ncbi:unnamed protein product, partial [marine sediment metagenome]
MTTMNSQFDMDLQEVVTEKRFVGMWRLLHGYRLDAVCDYEGG